VTTSPRGPPTEEHEGENQVLDRFRVVGGSRLAGEVRISGAKNSVLKLMAVTLLAPGKSTIANVPNIADVEMMAELLRTLDCEVEHNLEEELVTITVPQTPGFRAEYESVRKLRASINVLGPLVARLHRAEVALPGGDAIGSRGLDFHTRGLVELGATAEHEHGYIIATAPDGLKGARVQLDFPSVGATENIMTAAVLAQGTTVLENAAREPDIVDIGNFLIEMGAEIEGLGSSTLTITGVKELRPASHIAIPDRIVTGTWAFAAAMTQGDITIHGARPDDLELPLEKLVASGAIITRTADGLRVKMERRPTAIDISTLPYPGFPTDLQPFAITLNAIADGESMVTENVFEGRFMFVNELLRLGAKIRVDGHHASISGCRQLSSAPVLASDIRAGAGLVLAGLVADGVTFVEGAFHVDRGYPNFAQQLRDLGADVTRVE
jgi:UDP-N-acetylglucosamine 1-carboxyvinyltransferase